MMISCQLNSYCKLFRELRDLFKKILELYVSNHIIKIVN